MHATLQGLPGLEVIVDDILVFGCGDTAEGYQRDHDTNLQCLLQQAHEKNLKLNKVVPLRSFLHGTPVD